MYSGMTGQLVRTAESFGASGIGARVRLLAGVSADMSCLMFPTMEGLIAERAFVGTGHFALTLLLVGDIHVGDALLH